MREAGGGGIVMGATIAGVGGWTGKAWSWIGGGSAGVGGGGVTLIE